MTKIKTLEQRRIRAAKSVGLIPVRMWATKAMAQDINRMRDRTDAMIEAELARKHSNKETNQ